MTLNLQTATFGNPLQTAGSEFDTSGIALEALKLSSRSDIVFIDGHLEGVDQIIQSLSQGAEVVLLDGRKDGFAQMAAYLAGRHDIDAISLISHGETGAVKAGNVWLTSDTLTAHADALRAIGGALTADGDLLLYGCKVGADNEGQALLSQIAAITSADVAGSVDNTGGTALGGNWTLERSTGHIEAAALSGAAFTGYGTLLAAPTTLTVDGVVLQDGRQTIVSQGQSSIVDGWTLSILDSLGQNDSQSFIVYTNESANTSLANDFNDKAVLMLGGFQAGMGQAAAVLKATTGEDFGLQSVTVENYSSVGSDYTLVGYRNGVEVSGARLNFSIPSNLSAGLVLTPTGTAWANLDEIRFVRTGGQSDISLAIDDVIVVPANAVPVIDNLDGDAVAFTEKGGPILLDASGDVTVTDTDNANFSGGALTFSIVSNRVATNDVLTILDNGTGAGAIGVSGNNVTYGGTLIGTFAGGTGNNDLVISLNANATKAATAALIRNVAYYDNSATDPYSLTRTVRVTLDDGAGGTSTAANVTVQVRPVNDAPTIIGNGLSPTYTEEASGVTLFNITSLSTVEADQKFQSVVLSVSNVSDGSSEILRIDGSDVSLFNANALTTANLGLQITVSVSGGVATVSINKGSPHVDAASMRTMLNAMTYRDTSDNPTGGARGVILTAFRDNGGLANGGSDTTFALITSSVTVVGINDAPIVTTSGSSVGFTAGDNTP